jgi:hypothetical protein
MSVGTLKLLTLEVGLIGEYMEFGELTMEQMVVMIYAGIEE